MSAVDFLSGGAEVFRNQVLNLELTVQDKNKDIKNLKNSLKQREDALKADKRALEGAKTAIKEAETRANALQEDLKSAKQMNLELRSQLASAKEQERRQQEHIASQNREFVVKFDRLTAHLTQSDKDDLHSPNGPASSASQEAGGNKDKDKAILKAMDEAPAASFENQLKASSFFADIRAGSEAMMDVFELWQSGLCYDDVSGQNEAKMIAIQQLIDTINDVESRQEEDFMTNNQEEEEENHFHSKDVEMQLEGGLRPSASAEAAS